MVSDFSKRQLSILLFILRLSWGCGKKEALIPYQSDFEIVGVGSGHIKVELDWLVEAKVIYRNGNLYGFNKNYDDWRVSRAKAYHQQKLTEMVKTNINHNSQNGNTKTVRDNEENYRNGKPQPEGKVTKRGSEELPKEEAKNYQKRNSPTPKLASPKEILKKDDRNSKTLSNTKVNNKNINRLVVAEVHASATTLFFDTSIKKFSYAFGREPDSRERAQLRDLGIEVVRAGGATEQQTHDAFKEAALHNKCNISYVRAILLDWLGVPR